MATNRYFLIKDLNCTVLVEIVKTQKEVFDWLDDMIDNLPYEWFHTDDVFEILYKERLIGVILEEELLFGSALPSCRKELVD